MTPVALQPWPLVTVGVTIQALLLAAAKNYLDKGKLDYTVLVEAIVTINRDEARRQLKWIADDFMNAKSTMSLTHLDSEDYVHRQTTELVKCFRRIRTCRRGMKLLRIGFETTKWSAIVGLFACVSFAAGNVLSMPLVIDEISAVVSIASALLSGVAFVFSELWLQIVRNNHDESKDIVATEPS